MSSTRLRSASIAALVAVSIPIAAAAHNPRIVEGSGMVAILKPEQSQAFYGELRGEPARFSFETAAPISFYAGALSPDIPGADRDYSVSVMLDGRPWKLVMATEADWSLFHEEFAGDDYFQGPEIHAEGPAGRYDIAVFSPDNRGKYVLVVGEKESLAPSDIVDMLAVLPRLKTEYFGKPWISAFTNRIGAYLAGAMAAILASVALLVRRCRRKRG